MKKFVLGLICGIGLTATTAVYASDMIQAYLFPAKLEINGQSKELDSEYKILNYNGHAYFPIRFIAENLELGVKYSSMDNIISIMKEPTQIDEYAHKVWLIQYKLNVGQNQNYVKNILGEPSVVIMDDLQQEVWWRYDISAKPNYKYNQVQDFDIKGLENGDLNAQLYIKWLKQEKIEDISLGYTKGKDAQRRIYFHYVLPDGSTPGGLYE
ncbi:MULTISPECIES: stalk domain-containing protein [unclassified Paenibacillus]|uniref:stalk domain-containing protein n=1 Tax=unclassified Paenibacillus TaxID=185978 RepID=UPI0027854726|nr:MULTISPECIES: stalk domain-containing protein [unclassified Paenibacillus]MDQ0896192.1 hypothetical protein [Paenibacillus sp. V4I7]MDQ0913992.1 hypothetical protein [Paenibacillus sp. V4I5]